MASEETEALLGQKVAKVTFSWDLVNVSPSPMILALLSMMMKIVEKVPSYSIFDSLFI